MSSSISAVLGIAFLGLSVASVFLMFQYWGYPYDKEKKKSACPQWKMNIHRAVGYAYLIVYVVMMTQMVPRLWRYQVEFAPRTVAHILLGITIGVILLVKISIIRWFRHFEEWMPVLGVSLMLCTFLLTGLSVPFVLKERQLAASAVGGGVYSAENRARIAELLPAAGFPSEVEVAELATEKSLRAGREVLLTKCVECHDLKTVITKPRSPSDWVATVSRMADKPTLGSEIAEEEGYQAAAYLIAITPDLQRSAKRKRQQMMEQAAARAAVAQAEGGAAAMPAGEGGAGGAGGEAGVPAAPAPPPFDHAAAKMVFEKTCSQCHELTDVDGKPPHTEAEARALVRRMVDENGLEAKADDLSTIERYLVETYVKM